MKKAIVFIFVLFLPISVAFSMSKPAKVLQTSPPEASVAQPVDGNTAALIKSAAQEICDGNFNAAEQILSSAFAEASSDKQAGAKNPSSSAFAENKGVLSDIISQYRQIGLARRRSQKQSFDKRLAELEKLKARPETNEPNLLEVFPVIIRIHEFADDDEKEPLLSDELIRETITTSRHIAAEYESKGRWLDTLLYCYIWFAAFSEDEKTASDVEKEFKEKTLIIVSMEANSGGSFSDCWRKVQPEMFIGSLDELEVGRAEPLYYSDMAREVLTRFRYLADVLDFQRAFDKSFAIEFSKDRLSEFRAGLELLGKDYDSGLPGSDRDKIIKLFKGVLALNSATLKLPESMVVWHFAEASFSVLDPQTVLVWLRQKEQVLSDEFVQKTITKSRQAAAEFESKGKWLNSLLYCYSWLGVLYEDDKAISDKKKELEEKALIEASLMDNPCETCADRYQKIKPEMFTRSLDVLEYGYVEPFYYSDMADKVFSRFRNLAEVLRFSDSSGSKVKVTIDSSGEKLPEPVTGGRITIAFSKDKLPDFAAGLDSLRKNYSLGPIGLNKDQFLRLFGEVLVLNSATIRLPEQIVIWHFAEASLSALDPHTMIAWPREKEDFEKSMTNEFSGIGVEISKADGLLRAVSLLPGTPAYNSGIDAGDVIETINGESTKDMSIACAVSKITGPVGTKVAIAIRRANEEKTRNIEVTRAKIIVPTTRGWSRDELGNWLYFVDEKDSIGYIRITNFSATTASDLNEILTMLEVQGMRALVLDLRFNTGGFLRSAADVTDMFVDKGIIVSTQPRVGLPTWEAAHKKGTHPYYPLVILINSSSASASEIVAGALADKTYSRTVLVGEQSYGKGSVQTISGYPGDGAQLKYTMAYYHLPDGSRVKDHFSMEKVGRKDWGIMPNVQIELRSDEIKKMIDVQRDNDVLAAPVLSTKAETGAENKSKLTRHGLAETLRTDSQLAVAVLVAKAKLIESGLQQ